MEMLLSTGEYLSGTPQEIVEFIKLFDPDANKAQIDPSHLVKKSSSYLNSADIPDYYEGICFVNNLHFYGFRLLSAGRHQGKYSPFWASGTTAQNELTISTADMDTVFDHYRIPPHLRGWDGYSNQKKSRSRRKG